MKRIILTLILSTIFLSLVAQDFEIVSVEHLPNDFAAREEMKTDHNDRQCALLRIATQRITPEQREGFTFKTDLGSELVERATRNGEIWLWVSPGLKYLRVMHSDWGQYELRLMDYVARIEELHTYKIVVKGPELLPPPPPEEDKPKKQFLAFQITPVNAVLEVDGKVWSLDASGGASRYLDFGTYSYRVRASDYFPEEGLVTVNDPDNTQIVTVELRPDFAEVTLKVDADAEIWVNNQRKGRRTWTGQLGSGSYKMECRQPNHETSVTNVEITASMTGQTITLPTPKPIYGSLQVESVPNFCKLFIDGKEVGTTPKSVNEILIGTHEIKISKEGYADHTETITIAKGERKQVSASLSNGKQVQFTCNVPDAQLEIDGQRVGAANGTYMLTYGSHSLRATAADYRDYTANVSVGQSGSGSYSIQMQSVARDEETFTVNGVSFTMKLVEGGTFRMGAQKTSSGGQNYDSEANDFESPVHSVTLSSYYMGETEVTQALWKAVMGSNPSYFQGDSLPVEQVSWNDVQEFIRKLNQTKGWNFRLPTEAEWEYAARGGKKSNGYKYAGNNNVGIVAWYADNRNGTTHAVKGKSPNELGLYDMSGNVWEWCQDWYSSDYYGKSPSANPQGPSSGSYRVVRGGCWINYARFCRVSSRRNIVPSSRKDSYGFRLCLPQ